MKLPVRSNRSRFDSTMTPMIDVVFLLLIFFVCTVSFQTLEGMLPTRLSTPQAAGVEAIVDPQLDELEPVVVKIMQADGRLSWMVGQARCATLAELQVALQRLAQVQATLPVILDIDGEVPLGDVVAAYDSCLVAGFQKIQFAASVDPG